jgi:hypothetical protein
MDVNKAIQRSLTKACARHGLGLYIYAGEDLPEEEAKAEQENPVTESDAEQENPVAETKAADDTFPICEDCGRPIKDIQLKDGTPYTAQEIMDKSRRKYGVCLCFDCCKARASA